MSANPGTPDQAAPPTVRTRVRVGTPGPAALFDPPHPMMAAASSACLRGFGRRPAFILSGGTIPAAGLLGRHLGAPVVLLGLVLPDYHAHALHERFHLPNLWAGTETAIWFLAELASRAWPARAAGDREDVRGRPGERVTV